MSKIFTRTFRVRWGELDPSGTVSPANYLRYLIETAWDWGTAIGWGEKYSQNPDVFWVIRETEIRFQRPLHHNDVFDFTIWMVNWQRVRGKRCFELKLQESGEVIAQGTQQVVFMDMKTGRPISLSEEEVVKFRLEDPRVFPFERFPKIAAVENPFVTQRQVEWMDLDMYDHVNNVIYVNYAEEAAVQDFSARGWSPVKLAEAGLVVVTKRLHVQYLSIAVWGETLNISTHPLEVKDNGSSRYVGITREDGSSVTECILDWELVDRTSGEARSLPDELR
ncbi:MAG TPA: thioesterase family protein [Anaerolineales bacterium]|nr:thioesterase family protein [Anaerolineales bacterium]